MFKELKGIDPLETDRQIAIAVHGVTVAYRAYRERPTSLKESVLKFLRHGTFRHYSTFDALSGVSFSLPKGSVLGIIGSNGSGKSTLLRVLGQVLEPTQGYATINGRVASLIELGAGFDPDLNAVENIFLNGSLFKKSRAEMASRVDAILEFSELTEFRHTPVKYYSSGMYARLGFSVAIDIDPDILLVDEILAVGDERFQQKCMDAMDSFVKGGKTIVIVSHNLDWVSHKADTLALLSRGELIFYGDPAMALEMYRSDDYQTRLGS